MPPRRDVTRTEPGCKKDVASENPGQAREQRQALSLASVRDKEGRPESASIPSSGENSRGSVRERGRDQSRQAP